MNRSIARVIDVHGSTILPGLMDTHIHFFGSKKYDMAEWVTTPETLVALRSVADTPATEGRIHHRARPREQSWDLPKTGG